MSAPVDVSDTLDEIKRVVLHAFPSSVEAVYVMGSITREATQASDIDVAVVFEDRFYNDHIDEILPRLTAMAREVSDRHPRHPLALWASKVDHYKTLFPDVSYVRRNLPRDQDRLDAWSGLAKHTLIHYESRSCHLIHGRLNIGEHMPARLPAGESLELFLLSTRTLAEALAELSQSDAGGRRQGMNHLAKAGLRAAYAVAIREEGTPLDSYADILAWAQGRWPAYDATLATLYAMKTGTRAEAPDVASVVALMRHCESRIANAPRLRIGGLTTARAGESFSFDPDDLVRDADPIERYSRFAGFQANYIHSLYFLLTARAVLDRLLRSDADDVAVLDFFFEELSILASYAFFNPGGVRLVLGKRERDAFSVVVDMDALKGLFGLLSRLAVAYAAADASFDLPWLTQATKRARVRSILSEFSNIPGAGFTTDDPPQAGEMVATLEWQAAILTGLFNPRLITVFNEFGLVLYQSGLLLEAQRVLSLPLKSVESRDDVAGEMGLSEAAVKAIDRELSKTHQYYALTFHRLNDVEAARASYLQALALDPDNYSALCDLTTFLLANDADDEAIVALTSRLLKAVVSTQSESHREVAERFLDHAVTLKQAGRLDEAESWYRRSIEADPSYEKPAYNLGILLEQTGRQKEAVASYRLAIQTDPRYAQPYVRLGGMLQAAGDTAGAERLLMSGAEQGASSEYLYANLGNYQFALGKHSDAFANFRKALEVNGQHADAWNGLGIVLMTAGAKNADTYRQAAECFHRAFQADPSFSDAQVNYQRALERLAAM